MQRHILKRRILFTLLMASMLFGIAFSSIFTTKQRAEAQQACGEARHVYYFTGPIFHRTQVGESWIDCNGTEYMYWGTTGPYTMSTATDCYGNPCNVCCDLGG
jgi:hypothetical protein